MKQKTLVKAVAAVGIAAIALGAVLPSLLGAF
jgi:hypothetical protein